MVLSMKKAVNKDVKSEQLEELHYGPGIVSKLRCRYMSLTLNQACAKQRPSINFLRRSTSLNNLIDVSESVVEKPKTDPKNEIIKLESSGDEKTKVIDFSDPKNVKDISSNNKKTSDAPLGNMQNEQPPTDMVKEKLRIFEPNWINHKKVHYSKKYNTNKHVCAVSSKNVSILREKYKENDECIPIFANRGDTLIFDKQMETKDGLIEKKSLEQNHVEKQNSKSVTDSSNGHEMKSKNSQNTSQFICSVDNQSMVFNFSKRKEIPPYLPDIESLLEDQKRNSVDNEDSPSTFEFLNANIIIDGKSCMKSSGKNVKLKIKFNDLLTSTFEYPPESCSFEPSIASPTKTDMNPEKTSLRSKLVLVVSKNGAEATDDFSGCKTDSKAFWSEETHATDILF